MQKNPTVIGRTPPFVRWSIRQACRLRLETDVADPQQTERALRSIQQAGIALAENRVVDGVAVKELRSELPRVQQKNASRATVDDGIVELGGFFLDEVTAAFGGLTFVQKTCQGCAISSGATAGCFGMLTKDDFDNSIDADCWRQSIESHPTPDHPCLTDPIWFGTWVGEYWHDKFLPVMIQRIRDATVNATATQPFEDFAGAVELAATHGCDIDFQSFPSGNSDGLVWSVDAHCRRCKAVRRPDDRACRVCGCERPSEPMRRRKVIGMRPYVPLTDLVGAELASQLEKQFDQNRFRKTD